MDFLSCLRLRILINFLILDMLLNLTHPDNFGAETIHHQTLIRNTKGTLFLSKRPMQILNNTKVTVDVLYAIVFIESKKKSFKFE